MVGSSSRDETADIYDRKFSFNYVLMGGITLHNRDT